MFMDGVWHKRSWGGAVENVSVLVAIGVGMDGHREVIGVTEGMKEDAASWQDFIRSLIKRGLKGVRLVVGETVRRTGECRGRAAARSKVSALHGALRAQHPLQGVAAPHAMGSRRAQSRLRVRNPPGRTGQGRQRRSRDGGTQAQGCGRVPARGNRKRPRPTCSTTTRASTAGGFARTT